MEKRYRKFLRRFIRIQKELFVENFTRRKIINASVSNDTLSPVFFLSPGRCGTEFMTEILSKDPKFYVSHNPKLELRYEANIAFQERDSVNVFNIFRAARRELIQYYFSRGRIYIETNNKISFFSYAIRNYYPNARFVVIVRERNSWIESATKRGYFKDKFDESGFIRSSEENWLKMSASEKIEWLYDHTYDFINDFTSTLPEANLFTVRFDELFTDPDKVLNLVNWISSESKLSTNKIVRAQRYKVNA